jgi:hypothetical protein
VLSLPGVLSLNVYLFGGSLKFTSVSYLDLTHRIDNDTKSIFFIDTDNIFTVGCSVPLKVQPCKDQENITMVTLFRFRCASPAALSRLTSICVCIACLFVLALVGAKLFFNMGTAAKVSKYKTFKNYPLACLVVLYRIHASWMCVLTSVPLL